MHRRKRHDRTIGIMVLLAPLAGCADLTSIYHNRAGNGPGARVVTIDAKQRNVFLTPPAPGSDPAASWHICAEASPDVFSALSASASLDADVASRSGKAAAAIAESAGTIERTQTVNLLRESMYRTCERFLSGALSRQQFIVQAARDQRSMVAVLAIEQLTRAATPAATILAASGTSANSASDQGVALIQQFATEKSDAGAALKAATAAYQAALPAGKCDTVTTAPAAGATGPSLADWTACTTAQATEAARQKDYDAASARLDTVLAAVKAGGTTGAATTAGTNQGGGGAATPVDLAAVANVVAQIAMSPGIDEPLMFCIAYLSDVPTADSAHPVLSDPAVTNSCIQTLQLRAKTDELHRDNQDASAAALHFQFTAYHAPVAGDAARPLLEAYLDVHGNLPEGRRRVALARKGADLLGLTLPGGDLVRFLDEETPDAHGRLLDWLRIHESVPSAAAALTAS